MLIFPRILVLLLLVACSSSPSAPTEVPPQPASIYDICRIHSQGQGTVEYVNSTRLVFDNRTGTYREVIESVPMCITRTKGPDGRITISSYPLYQY